jgi:hypothetical protein
MKSSDALLQFGDSCRYDVPCLQIFVLDPDGEPFVVVRPDPGHTFELADCGRAAHLRFDGYSWLAGSWRFVG